VTEGSPIVNMGAEASLRSSEETAAKVELASELNEDPAVAQVLEDAAVAADTTVARVGWLRSYLKRLWPARVA
jgi:hypothetical protein